jgi:hypothetical protein
LQLCVVDNAPHDSIIEGIAHFQTQRDLTHETNIRLSDE